MFLEREVFIREGVDVGVVEHKAVVVGSCLAAVVCCKMWVYEGVEGLRWLFILVCWWLLLVWLWLSWVWHRW